MLLQNNYSTAKCPRETYTHIVGQLGEDVFRKMLTGLGFPVEDHDLRANGADIKFQTEVGALTIDGQRYHVKGGTTAIEVSNEDTCSYINTERSKDMKRNLHEADYRGIITGHGVLTKRARKYLRRIPKLSLGFQMLPVSLSILTSKNRLLVTQSLFDRIRRLLVRFLVTIGLLVLIYVPAIGDEKNTVLSTLQHPTGSNSNQTGLNKLLYSLFTSILPGEKGQLRKIGNHR